MNTLPLFDNSHRLSVLTNRRLLELIEVVVLRHRGLLADMVHR